MTGTPGLGDAREVDDREVVDAVEQISQGVGPDTRALEQLGEGHPRVEPRPVDLRCQQMT